MIDGGMINFVRNRGFGLAVLPPVPRLAITIGAILFLQTTTALSVVIQALAVSTLLLLMNLHTRFKWLIVTSALITFGSIFFGNVLFPPARCVLGLENILWLHDIRAFFGECGFDTGIILGLRRVAMLLLGFAWLNATRLNEMADVTAMPFRHGTFYPYRAVAITPYAIARRIAAEYSISTKSIAIRTPPQSRNLVRSKIFITFLKLSALILRLFSNTQKVAFAIAMHGSPRPEYQQKVHLQLKNVVAGYDGRIVLKELSFQANNGDIVYVGGKPGSGKSTLLRTISRYIPRIAGFATGTIKVNDIDWNDVSLQLIETLPSVRVLSSDSYEFFVGITVEQEMLFHASQENAERALLSMGLSGMWSRDIETLSGGERMRLALACILASKSKFLILDNPLSQLDAGARESLALALSNYVKEVNPVIIMTDPYPAQFSNIVTRYVELTDGLLVEKGLDCFRALGAETSISTVGSRHVPLRPRSPDVVASLSDAEVSLGGKIIFRGLNFQVHAGEIVGLVGPNGSGKTTAMMALAGTIPLTRGEVSGPTNVGMSFQNPGVQFVRLKVGDELELKPHFAEATDSENALFRERELHWLRLNAGAEVPDLPPTDERLLSVSAMLFRTRVLVIDEPDIELRGQNLEYLLYRINALSDEGTAVIIISHSPRVISFVERVVDLSRYAPNA